MKTFFRLILILVMLPMYSQNITFTQPPFLQQGDTILIVAPSGVIKQPTAIQKAKEQFENWGYQVILAKHVLEAHHHFAGNDAERLQDMQWALDHPTAKAIWCARGGYGSVRIIDDLDFSKFGKHPKWMIGYSDFTVFHNKLHNLGFQSIHAPMPINFKQPWLQIEESMLALNKALQNSLLSYEIPSNPLNITGKASGILVGGNLTILENMIGTNTDFSTKNKILFIEEIGEYKYHIDRLLRALDRKGYFKHCNGLILGDFTNIKKNSPAFGQTIEELILEIVAKYTIPVVFDFPAGHEDKNMPLFFGKEITLEVSSTSAKINFTN